MLSTQRKEHGIVSLVLPKHVTSAEDGDVVPTHSTSDEPWYWGSCKIPRGRERLAWQGLSVHRLSISCTSSTDRQISSLSIKADGINKD